MSNIGKSATKTPNALRSVLRQAQTRLMLAIGAEEGTSTVEYAVATVAAAAFGAVLYGVVTGGNVVDALTRIIDKALNTGT